MSVVDLTLDSDDSIEYLLISKNEGFTLRKGLPQSYKFNQDRYGCDPRSPAESIDSRDDIFSLEDICDPPNVEVFIHSDSESDQSSVELLPVHHDPEIIVSVPKLAAEYDSDIEEIEPELASKAESDVENDPESADKDDSYVIENELVAEEDSDVKREPELTAEDNSEIISINPESATEDLSEVEDVPADMEDSDVVEIEPESAAEDDSDVENDSECADKDDSDVVEIESGIDSDASEIESEGRTLDFTLPDKRQRLYKCTFCDFSTEVEEWLHKHMVSHAPGNKPYVRVYCPDCTYSTGSLKFLFFHMLKIHEVNKPAFYRIGEKRYRCHHCQISVELRIDIEEHVSKHLSDLKKRNRQLRLKYMCPVSKCRFSSEEVEKIHHHIKKSHNVANPTCYKERDTYRVFYHCFKCSFVSPYIKSINKHSLKHYSKYELKLPYRFLCPSKSCKFSTSKDYKITKHLKSKHSAARAYYRVDSKSFKCFTCGIRKNTSRGMVSHCRKHRKKNRRIANRH